MGGGAWCRLLSMGPQRVGHDWETSSPESPVQDWLVWSPCSPRDSQESSPTPQFKSISSSVLSLLYGPALTSIHDYWENHSFDYTDLFLGKVMSLLFNTLSRGRKASHYYHEDCLIGIAKHNIENNKSTSHKYCGNDYQKVKNNYRKCDG